MTERARSGGRRVPLLLAVCWLIVAALAPARATASPPSRAILLLRADHDDAAARQAATLLMAELAAASFEPVEIDRDPSRAITADLDAGWTRLRPLAAFVIAPGASVTAAVTIDLWVEDRPSGRRIARRIVAAEGANTAADIALKAVELLHGSLLEVALPASAPPATAIAGAPAAPQPPAPRSDYFTEGLAVSAGAGVLDAAGIDASVAPVVRLGWGGARGYAARITVTGLGSVPEVRAPEGVARVRRNLVGIEALRVFRAAARVQPWLGAGVGAYIMTVDGTGVSPLFQSRAVTQVSPALSAQGGVAVRLTSRLALVVDASVCLARETRISFAGSEAARVGELSALVTPGLAARF